jgi:multiple sugar transport system substrate-binding protein
MAQSHEEELARELMRRGLSRREVLKIGLRLGLGATSLGALLAACGGAAQQPAAAPTAAPAQAPAAEAPTPASAPDQQASIFDEAEGAQGPWPKPAVAEPTSKVTLSVAHAWDATFMKRQNQFDNLFMQRHPNIEIKAENTPFPQYLQKYTAQAAGNALPDILYVQFAWAQQLIKGGLLRPLDDYIAQQKDFKLEDFTKQSLVSYQREGKLYGVPYDEGPGNLYYNKDLFDKAGVKYPDDSWDLEMLKQNAIKLTSGEGPNKIYGLAELPSPGNGLMAPGYLFPFGAQYLAEPKEDQVLINKPEAVAAMEWWEEVRAKGAVPNPADTQALAWPAFQFGKIAMFYEGSWATPPIRENSKFNWDVAIWPKGPKAHNTFSAGSCYTITRDSKNPDAAWIYLNDYLSTAGQAYMWGITGRGSPARLSAWPSYLSSKFAPPGAKFIQQAMTTIASHDILDQPTGPKVTQVAQPIWDLVIAGQLKVKDALDQVAAAIEPIIAENRA